MRLTDEERAIHAGEQGPVRQWAIRHQIVVGEFFDASDLVPVGQAHIMADTESLGEVGVAWLESLAAAPEQQRRVRIPTITDPRGLDFASYKRLRQTEAMAAIEARTIAAFEALGVLMTNTCINYQTILPPVRGEHLALGDTGVTIYSNSVMGAHSNFEGGPIGAGRRAYGPHSALRLSPGVATAAAPCFLRSSTSPRTSPTGARWAASSAVQPTAIGKFRLSLASKLRRIPTSLSISGRRWRASVRWRCSICRALRRKRGRCRRPFEAERSPPAIHVAKEQFDNFFAGYAATGRQGRRGGVRRPPAVADRDAAGRWSARRSARA